MLQVGTAAEQGEGREGVEGEEGGGSTNDLMQAGRNCC